MKILTEAPSAYLSSAWTLPLVASVLLLVVLVPSMRLGLLSDDLSHLVEDADKPWHLSSDHFNRPLRNGYFKLMAHTAGIDPLPYRIGMVVAFGCILWLLYIFQRQLQLTVQASTAGCVLVAFFPRNHEVLFWFAAFQDLVLVALALLCAILWLRNRSRSSRPLRLWVLLSTAMALGFKETAVVIPVLLLCLDLYITVSGVLRPRWRDHWPQWVLLVVYLLYVLGTRSTPASLTGIYTLGNLGGILSAALRSVANICLQFSPAKALRELTIMDTALCVLLVLALLAGVFTIPRRALAIFGLLWAAITFTPTVLFARTVNADRYLLFPYVGIAISIAAIADSFLSHNVHWKRVALTIIVTAYSLAGTVQLIRYRQLWRSAALEVRHFVQEAQKLYQGVPAGSRLYFVNVLHSRDAIPVLNNGLRGALMAAGFDRRISVTTNFADPLSMGQQSLLQQLLSCPLAPPEGAYIGIWTGDHLADRTGTCGRNIIAADLHNRPLAWFE
jgi:hypothetical protein